MIGLESNTSLIIPRKYLFRGKNFGTTKKSHFQNIVFQSTKLGINNGYLNFQNIIFQSRKSKGGRARKMASKSAGWGCGGGCQRKSEIHIIQPTFVKTCTLTDGLRVDFSERRLGCKQLYSPRVVLWGTSSAFPNLLSHFWTYHKGRDQYRNPFRTLLNFKVFYGMFNQPSQLREAKQKQRKETHTQTTRNV